MLPNKYYSIIAACLAGLLAQIPARAAEPPDSNAGCHLTEYASLSVQWLIPPPTLSSAVIAVELDDMPAKLMFDSAGTFSSIREDIAKQLKLGIKKLPRPLEMGSVRLDQYVTVPRLKLGNLLVQNVDMVLVPGTDRTSSSSIAGILTISALGNTDVELDLGHDKINVFSPDHNCRVAPVSWADSFAVTPISRGQFDELYFVMELEGKKLETVLSTMATVSFLSDSVSKKLYGFDENSPGLATLSYGNGYSLTRYKAMALTANGLKISNADIVVGAGSGCAKGAALEKDRNGAVGFYNCLGSHPLALGVGILKELRLYISVKDHKLYYTSWDAHRGDVSSPLELKTAEDFSNHAKSLLTDGHFVQAAAELTKATEMSPGEPKYFYQRAMVYEAAQQPRLAMPDLDQALKLNPNYAEARVARATLELRDKNPAAARADLDAAAKSATANSDMHYQIGGDYLSVGAPAQATAEFDRWINEHPNSASLAGALNYRCWTRALWGQELDMAEADCNAALKLRPGFPPILDSRAWVYFRRGDFQRSIDDFNAALREQPTQVSSLYGRGLAELRLGRKAAGRADINKAVQLQSNVSELYDRYGIKP